MYKIYGLQEPIFGFRVYKIKFEGPRPSKLSPMKLHIKNMVCNRCISVVGSQLDTLGLHPLHIGLGEVILQEEALDPHTEEKLDSLLHAHGFERIDDRKARLIERVKNTVIRQVHHSEDSERKINWSELLHRELNYEYNYLSGLFSSVEGITIEQYIIRQKTERVKELLVYDELTLSEIAWKTGYSSAAHLSSQFKKVTGFTPSEFKKSHREQRKPLDQV